MADFQSAVAFVLLWEGGYVNDPNDPGGETNFGISKHAYPDTDIAALTISGARAIYRRDYWDSIHCEELPAKLALIAFDCAVNQGPGTAARGLQEAVGATADGAIGPKTIAAANAADSEAPARFLAWREARYRADKNFALYGKGWLRRLADCAIEAGKL